MYKDWNICVTTAVEAIEEINIEVALHQGPALSPMLSIIMMDAITEDI
jgi:hypothetical protein